MMDTYLQGKTIWPYARFTDIADQPVDPTVVIIVQHPDGTTTSPTALNPEPGKWNFQLDMNEVGVYRWEFHGLTVEGDAPCEGSACTKPSLLMVS